MFAQFKLLVVCLAAGTYALHDHQAPVSYQGPGYGGYNAAAPGAPYRGYDAYASPPQPYSFGYDKVDEYGNRLFHSEQGDSSNAKTGSYGYRDAYGLYRRVNYVADANGFRATVDTNEPGTAPGASADVVFNAAPVVPPTPVGAAAALTTDTVDTETPHTVAMLAPMDKVDTVATVPTAPLPLGQPWEDMRTGDMLHTAKVPLAMLLAATHRVATGLPLDGLPVNTGTAADSKCCRRILETPSTLKWGYRDAYGLYRRVNYVADANGFRATVDTNEPGTAPGASADVVFNAAPVVPPTPGGAAGSAPGVASIVYGARGAAPNYSSAYNGYGRYGKAPYGGNVGAYGYGGYGGYGSYGSASGGPALCGYAYRGYAPYGQGAAGYAAGRYAPGGYGAAAGWAAGQYGYRRR
ncbi:hypothetical protein V5799_024124 [Amblyomma americanum]|uniref:Cuticle protein n=1 Tax=Amblyomma americanum TaxID=6943 RepID=A0AAQ4EDC0_AMBAM